MSFLREEEDDDDGGHGEDRGAQIRVTCLAKSGMGKEGNPWPKLTACASSRSVGVDERQLKKVWG